VICVTRRLKGFILKLPCYNSISNYFENEALTPYLHKLIEESSLRLTAIESDFSVDSSGFSACRFFKWVEVKYTNPTPINKREWVKIHLMCSVKTNIVTAMEIGDRFAADSPFSNRWLMRRSGISSCRKSPQTGVRCTITTPTIKNGFFSRVTNGATSNLPSQMIKGSLATDYGAGSRRHRFNEALCKIWCHYLCCVIQSMFELKIEARFWAEEPVQMEPFE
jgi:hypothetical protein